MFFTKYTLFAEKNFLYGKKIFIKIFLYWKKNFFTEKNINENVKTYISNLKICFYAENVCVTNEI